MLLSFLKTFKYVGIVDHFSKPCGSNPSSLNTRTHFSSIISTMVVGDLVMQGTKASAALVLTKFTWNNPLPPSVGLTLSIWVKVFSIQAEFCHSRCHFLSQCFCKMWFSVTVIGPHDDVIKWKHFPRNWPFVWEIHRSPVNFPHKGQWRGALMFSLIYAWMNDWVNNREAGDLRRQHGHYDVIVMSSEFSTLPFGQQDITCKSVQDQSADALAPCATRPSAVMIFARFLLYMIQFDVDYLHWYNWTLEQVRLLK